MTKEELKVYIQKLELEEELEKLIFELIDNSESITKELLSAIADILDNQADFYEKAADIVDDEAEEYEALGAELALLDEEEYQQRLEAINENQQNLLMELENKLKELNPTSAVPSEPTNPNTIPTIQTNPPDQPQQSEPKTLQDLANSS